MKVGRTLMEPKRLPPISPKDIPRAISKFVTETIAARKKNRKRNSSNHISQTRLFPHPAHLSSPYLTNTHKFQASHPSSNFQTKKPNSPLPHSALPTPERTLHPNPLQSHLPPSLDLSSVRYALDSLDEDSPPPAPK